MNEKRKEDVLGNEESEPRREHPGDKRYERPPESKPEPPAVDPQLDPNENEKM